MKTVLANAVLMTGLAAVVAACLNPALPPGTTRQYADGYRDGCDSGYSDAARDGYFLAYYKNQARYDSDADYRDGWDKAYAACYDEEYRTPYMMPGLGINTP